MSPALVRISLAWTLAAAAALPARAQAAVDLGHTIPNAATVAEGLFPKEEEKCEQVRAAGFKCMGFKPSVRYSLPATSFKLGSAELPAGLERQLDVFAEVLKAKKGSDKRLRIEGHADASGTDAINQTLSLERAQAVKNYLVQQGADPSMLVPVGEGSSNLKNTANPFAAENRRVEIGREPAS